MTSNEILKADLLDIVFENRNKLYGAYSLRKNYNVRLIIALAIALCSIFLLFFLGNRTEIKKGSFMDQRETVVVKSIAFPKIPLRVVHLPKTQMLPRLPHAVIPPDLRNILIKQDIDVKNIIPDLRTLENSPLSSSAGNPILSGSTSGNPIAGIGDVKSNSNEKVFIPVERAPEFPGGMMAWSRFLNKYLKTPDDMESGEKKTVLIRFQVSSDGSVTGFEVITSGGAEYDNEVIRVLKKMPKWNPAIQNGHAITVSFTQPVTFIGPEQ